MGVPTARLNDIAVGTCVSHPVPVPFTAVCVLGAVTVKCDGLNRATINSLWSSTCGHTFVSISGSTNVRLEGKGAARLNDVVVYSSPGVIVIGSPKTKTGG